ncbi:BRCT domain-containing protein [Caenorhabditis elegans]|uniref:BRCT domain-containing protein n=1 Tax=Caenorhabditis elegans TaxID=6239 RepID=Q19604_CAEEL|nr:BRCT domain-containing protein [Caenorhabditis elegans]CAA92167.2 BRCT domain-containing protein [Caenorhabditis elegans]|eukprot:NP_510078.2 Uncharacterized protein CELE_F19H6.3 [Caenorhabditis elegans]
MSESNKLFNPFGNHETHLKELKLQLEQTVLKSVQYIEDVNDLTESFEQLTEIAKSIPETSIKALISEVVDPLSRCISIFSAIMIVRIERASIYNLIQRLKKFIETIADRVTKPFDSEVLQEWTPIFISLLRGGGYCGFTEIGALLWNKTFGTVDNDLVCSNELKKHLHVLPSRYAINKPKLPIKYGYDWLFDREEWEKDEQTFSDGAGFTLPEVKTEVVYEERSLKFYQQPVVDDVAEIRYGIVMKHKATTRKNDLEEKVEEVSGSPNTINYMDEEAHDGFVKTDKIKTALIAKNLEVKDEKVKTSNKYNHPVSTFATESSRNPELAQNKSVETLEKFPELALIKLPDQFHGEKDSADVSDLKKSADSHTGIAQKEDDVEQKTRKKPVRSKLARKRSNPTRRSERLSEIQNNASVRSESSKTVDDNVQKAQGQEEVVDTIVKSMLVKEVADKRGVSATTSDKHLSDVEVHSPPKTPQTPSILRVGIRTSSYPMTETKRNRVHFDEESVPVDVVLSSFTLQQIPVVEASNIPEPEHAMNVRNSSPLLDNQSAPYNSFFYPSLANCRDKVDRILPKLVKLCTKTCVDSAKRSLMVVVVKTIGDFASLSKFDIEKFTWIKKRVAGAKNVLMQYEKSRNTERREEIADDSDERPMDATDTMPPAIECALPISSVFQPVPMETEANISPTNQLNTQESSESNALSVEATQPVLNSQNTPEASQSPASPISTDTGLSTSTVYPPAVQKNVSEVQSRQNLAPIFRGGPKHLKKAQLSSEMQFEHANEIERSFLEDRRILHRICTNLSHAHTQNHWPGENSSKLLSNINKASILFKNLVQTRGAGDWDGMNLNDGEWSTAVSDVATDVDALVAVYKRFSRHHTSLMANNLPWKSIMECINEAACLLGSIFLARVQEV